MWRRMLDGCAGMPRQAQMRRIERYFRAGCLKTSSAAAANGVVVVRTPWRDCSLCKQSDVSGMLIDVLSRCDGNKQQLGDVDGYVMDRGSHDAAARRGGVACASPCACATISRGLFVPLSMTRFAFGV